MGRRALAKLKSRRALLREHALLLDALASPDCALADCGGRGSGDKHAPSLRCEEERSVQTTSPLTARRGVDTFVRNVPDGVMNEKSSS
jgi:hypothetical protein